MSDIISVTMVRSCVTGKYWVSINGKPLETVDHTNAHEDIYAAIAAVRNFVIEKEVELSFS